MDIIGDLIASDTIFNTAPATHFTNDGIAVWKSTAFGYALGIGSITGDGNGIYSGSGTLSASITRALISTNNKLLFTQKYNSNADSTYLIFDNFDIDGSRSLRWGLTDTIHAGGYANGRAFKDDSNEIMGYETKTNDQDGETSIVQSGGTIAINSDGNFNVTSSEIRLNGEVIALQEAYNNVTSTTSPVTLSSTIPDNLINQGSTQATFTLELPPSPVDGQVCSITYANAITVLTIDGNGTTVVGSAVTTAVPGSRRMWKYYDSASAWIKIY
jgi:hypothetical protein